MKKKLLPFILLFCLFLCLHCNAQNGSVLVLNGTSQYMIVNDAPDLNIIPTTSKTITMWFKTTVATGNSRLLAKRSNANGVNISIGGIAGVGYEVFIGNSSGYKVGPNAENIAGTGVGGGFNNLVINDGNWHHVVYVLSNIATWSSTLYIDGANMTTSTNASTQDISNLVSLVVGAACDFSNKFPGSIDNVRIYNYSMTSTDVNTDKATTSVNGSTPGLVAAWDFEGVVGTNVPDVSGNNHLGTLVGNPTVAPVQVNMVVNATTLTQTVLPTGLGDADQRIISLKVTTDGFQNTLTASAINFTMTGTTNIADVSNIKIYSGTTAVFNPATATLYGSISPAAGNLTVNGSQALVSGDNYFWIAYDVAADATEGNLLDATCESIIASSATYNIASNTVAGNRVILLANTLLFTPGDASSSNYRIPAIITAADGSLVTATDKRWNGAGDLAAKIDPVIRRSTDNGKTWSAPVTIANFGGATGAGDCAFILDKTTGHLLCLFVAEKGFFASTAADPIKLKYCRSTDNGITWGAPVDITNQVYGAGCSNPITKNWLGAFIGSGRQFQMRDGRLVVALAVRDGSPGINNYMMYSTDGGINWTVSTAVAETGGDEAKLVELNNGNLLMSIRNSGTRRFNISTDKGLTWGTAYNQADITDPNCDGDIIRYTSTLDGFDKNRLLHTIPFAGNRTNVSVLLSTDEGATWPVRKTIFSGASAYSSLTVLPDGTLGIYYENGENSTYQMYFVRFSLNWLTNGADTYTAPTLGIGESTRTNPNFDAQIDHNPTDGVFNLKISNARGPVTVKIIDLSGKVLQKTTMNDSDVSKSFWLENQTSGVYIVQVNDTKSSLTRKVIRR